MKYVHAEQICNDLFNLAEGISHADEVSGYVKQIVADAARAVAHIRDTKCDVESEDSRRVLIQLSNADFVTGYESGAVSSTPSRAVARDWNEQEAQAILRKIKAKVDNAARLVPL